MRTSILACLQAILLIAAVSTIPSQLLAADVYGLTPGPVELKSGGPLSFGPSGVLFVGDPLAAKVYAINTEDTKKVAGQFDVKDVAAKVAAAFSGTKATIVDMAVNPETGNAFLSLSSEGQGHLAKVSPNGTVTPINLDKVGHATATLPNPPEDKQITRGRRTMNPRSQSITDLAYTDGKVLVAGLQAGESPSSVREFDFPFRDQSQGMRVEIYHAAHGRSEDYAAIQAFVPFNIGGEPSLLAGYTCTPLVKIPIKKLGSDKKITGTTVAELGNRNRPLDMIVYKSDGKDYVLMANSARGVMKISTAGLQGASGLTEKVSGGGTAGQTYETIEGLVGVIQLDKVDDHHALVMTQIDDGPISLSTIELP